MKGQRIFISLVPSAFLLILMVGLSQAQAPEPLAQMGTGASAQPSVVGTGFTYQGQLNQDGNPLSDTCDFRFILYDASTDGSQIGPIQDRNVQVANGLFTVPDLDFGASAFAGDARWLDISVKCGGEGSYTYLGRQAITAAPFALYAASSGALRSYPVTATTPALNQVLKWNGSAWAPAADEISAAGTGDITAVNAGGGLAGGGEAGAVTLTVNFAGNGSALTVARSDHDHSGIYAPALHVHAGEDIISGTVADQRIASTLARDSEIVPAVTAAGFVTRTLADTLYAATWHTHPGADITSPVPTATLAYYANAAPWSGLTGVPAGFADGVDNNTTYSAGSGLTLSNTTFSADTTYLQRRVGYACEAGQAISAINEDGSVTCQPTGSGDITAIQAGEGLTGGGTSGVVTLTVIFSGTGAAPTVARSDHNHDGVYTLVGHTHFGSDITSPVAQAMSATAAITATWASTSAYTAQAGNADLLDGLHASAFATSTHDATCWKLTGNSGTVPTTQFLGTMDSQPLVFRTNNTETLRIDASGNVGIGTNAPASKLTVRGNVEVLGQDNPIALGTTSANLSGPYSVVAAGHYAYVASFDNDSLAVFDVSDPNNPVALGATSANLDGPRSVAVAGRYAYVASNTNGRLAIFDVSDPNNLVALGYTSTNLNWPSSVVVAGRYAYVASAGNHSLAVFDVSDPNSPVALGATSANLYLPVSVAVAGHYAYVASVWNDRLAIFDVSNPNNLVAVGFTSANLDGPDSVAVAGRYVYVASANNDLLAVFDVSNPNNPIALGYTSANLDYPTSVVVAGYYAYVASADNDRLAVFDISDPNNLAARGYTSANLDYPFSVFVAGRTAYVASVSNSSLAVFELNHLEAPTADIGSLRADGLHVSEDAIFGNNLSVQGSLNVGSSALIGGDVGVQGSLAVMSNTVWHAGNDGAGSGLDADLLDGQHGAYYQARVSGACAVGSTVREIRADGSVTCEPHDALPVFSIATPDSAGNVGNLTSIAIGADGLALISHYDGANGDLKVTHCDDPACNTATTTTLDSNGDVGFYTSVAIGADGLGLIAYTEHDWALKVAHCHNIACTSATISTLENGLIKNGVALAIGADGLGLISYHNIDVGGRLKTAHCSNITCTTATITLIDSAGIVGEYSSIAIGADGLGLISYYDNNNGDLKAAHCSNITCTAATVSTVDNTNAGGGTSITIGSDGLGLISHTDNANGNIKVSHCNNIACTAATTTMIDGVSGSFTAITIGSDGLGLITYHETTGVNQGNLKVAHCTNLTCTSATPIVLDRGGDTGLAPSATVGIDGFPLISYYDNTNDDLKAAHCSNVFCTPYWRRR